MLVRVTQQQSQQQLTQIWQWRYNVTMMIIIMMMMMMITTILQQHQELQQYHEQQQYQQLFYLTDIIERLEAGDRPVLRPKILSSSQNEDKLVDVMRMCWEEIPAFRPNFVTVTDSLKKLNKGRWVWGRRWVVICQGHSQVKTSLYWSNFWTLNTDIYIYTLLTNTRIRVLMMHIYIYIYIYIQAFIHTSYNIIITGFCIRVHYKYDFN